MSSALVLNASYEPLSVVPARRAVCLVIADKAEIVETDGSFLHAATVAFPSPLVPFHRRTSLSRRALFARDEHRCQDCGAVADSIDHIVPKSRGGAHSWENVAAACRPCNLTKRDRTPDEAGMRLARPARAPRELTWVSVAVPRVPEAWKPYLALAS